MRSQNPIFARMKEPEKPLPTDCCGTGCMRCVYDIYLDQLKEYKAWQKSEEEKSDTGAIDGGKNQT